MHKRWGAFRGLNRNTAQLSTDPRRVIQETFRFAGGFLEPIQLQDEITGLVTEVRNLRPRTIVEIGTSMGGTLYLWTRFATPDAVIASIDLPQGKFGGGYSPLRIPLYRRFARERQKLHLLRCGSHSPDTVLANQVRALNGAVTLDSNNVFACIAILSADPYPLSCQYLAS